MSLIRCCTSFLALVLLIGPARAEAPPFVLSDDASAFLYATRPGDQPAAIARRFGLSPESIPDFLVANGITDATRMAVGQTLRIPNPLALRAADATARAEALDRERTDLASRVATLERDLGAARTRADEAGARAAHLERLERGWKLMQMLGGLLLLALGVAVWMAVTAFRKLAETERYIETLRLDLDQQRRRGLAERQESAKRTLTLEAQVNDLTIQLGSGPIPLRRPTGTH